MLVWGTDDACHDNIWVKFFCKRSEKPEADWFASELFESFAESCVLDPTMYVPDHGMVFFYDDFFVFKVQCPGGVQQCLHHRGDIGGGDAEEFLEFSGLYLSHDFPDLGINSGRDLGAILFLDP